MMQFARNAGEPECGGSGSEQDEARVAARSGHRLATPEHGTRVAQIRLAAMEILSYRMRLHRGYVT